MAELEPTPLRKKKISRKTFSIFPQNSMILPESFSKMELDTLFFASRYDSNEWNKLYAIKELECRGWKYQQDNPNIWIQGDDYLQFDTDSANWTITRL